MSGRPGRDWRSLDSAPRDGRWVKLMLPVANRLNGDTSITRVTRWSESRGAWETPGLLGSRRRPLYIANKDLAKWAPR